MTRPIPSHSGPIFANREWCPFCLFTLSDMMTVQGVDVDAAALEAAAAARTAGERHSIQSVDRALFLLETIAEAGGPDMEMSPWAALFAPVGTPAPLLEKIGRDVRAARSWRR